MNGKTLGWCAALVVALAVGCSVSESESDRVVAVVGACFPEDLVHARPHPEGTITVGGRVLGASERDCLAAAGTSCSRAAECLRITFERGPCAPGCAGSIATVCVRPSPPETMVLRLTEDCGAFGEICADTVDGPRCVTGLCSAFRCNGPGEAVLCSVGVELTDVCTPGTTCSETLERCAGAACTASTCDGDVASTCDVPDGVVISTFDCASVGARCVDGACAPLHDECMPFSDFPVCDGDRVRYCRLEGTVGVIDCVGLGFGACVEGRCTAPPS